MDTNSAKIFTDKSFVVGGKYDHENGQLKPSNEFSKIKYLFHFNGRNIIIKNSDIEPLKYFGASVDFNGYFNPISPDQLNHSFIEEIEDILSKNIVNKLGKEIIDAIKEYIEKIKQGETLEQEEPEKVEINMNLELDIEKRQQLMKKMKDMVDKKTLQKAIAGITRKKFAQIEGMDEILDLWADSKVEIFKLFGEKLVLSNEIDFEITDSEMSNMVDELCHKYPQYALVLKTFSAKSFVNNKIYNTNSTLVEYTGKSYENEKLSKFLNSLIQDKEFEIELSKILQCKKIKGFISLSIDPIDYLFMSYNKSGWDSCSNVMTGCYKASCFTMMYDKGGIVAYKSNGRAYEYDIRNYSVKTNSKNWRQLVYYDKKTQGLLFSREYPHSNTEIAQNIRYLIEEQIANYFQIENLWKTSRYIKNASRYFISSEMDDMFYNDVLNGYDYVFAYNKNVEHTKIRFPIGVNEKDKVICPVCGVNGIYDAEQVRCDHC